ncbi:pantetheine-phosphate adenylyltransferase [Kosmotoga pacifica]|uniref:Phosphopantetheine adenylyltransferase n=1 Tax=Kosmotoga pacifica TaxID=1330330 RepID=A0A0G2ZB82_9BACT|nr:pantetheine-phosphate adenylyltransferase [Kosmotoga pacifica]AKI96829.1 phosphopantetheine adenylyltransferase [Kosmotoga pacifica]
MKRAVYPGSFDPITYGHIDILNRAAKIFDEVIVLVMNNINKKYFFSFEERFDMVKEAIKAYENVKVETYDGLLVEYTRKREISVLVRGLRAVSDFEYELQMAHMNKSMCPNLETVFLMTDSKYSFISSTVVREVARFGGDVSPWVPKYVIEAFKRRLG